jgi:hypothetical protein
LLQDCTRCRLRSWVLNKKKENHGSYDIRHQTLETQEEKIHISNFQAAAATFP